MGAVLAKFKKVETPHVKAIVELLHIVLSWVSQHRPESTQIEGVMEFVRRSLANPLEQKDILTQSSLILWTMRGDATVDQLVSDIGSLDHQTGILAMAYLRGFVIFKDEESITTILEEQSIFGYRDFVGYVIECCQMNEGLPKLYSF